MAEAHANEPRRGHHRGPCDRARAHFLADDAFRSRAPSREAGRRRLTVGCGDRGSERFSGRLASDRSTTFSLAASTARHRPCTRPSSRTSVARVKGPRELLNQVIPNAVVLGEYSIGGFGSRLPPLGDIRAEPKRLLRSAHEGNRNSPTPRRRRIQRSNCHAGAKYGRLLPCIRGSRQECASVALAATRCGKNAPTVSGNDGFAAHLSRLLLIRLFQQTPICCDQPRRAATSRAPRIRRYGVGARPVPRPSSV